MNHNAWVAGVDGCRGGWIVVLRPAGDPAKALVRLVPQFRDVLELPEAPIMIAIDIPIGLPDISGLGGRRCDIEARRPLGARKSSVFAVPARAAVAELDYGAACRAAQRHSDPPRKISKQTFNLFAKIREVDALMTPALQDRVRECHPELVFWRLNGQRPLELPKKVNDGLALRRRLLVQAGYPNAIFSRQSIPKSAAGADDVIDAFANATAAADMVLGTAHRVPDTPLCDGRGLRMEIWG